MFGSRFLDNGSTDSPKVYCFGNCDSRSSFLFCSLLDIFALCNRKLIFSFLAPRAHFVTSTYTRVRRRNILATRTSDEFYLYLQRVFPKWVQCWMSAGLCTCLDYSVAATRIWNSLLVVDLHKLDNANDPSSRNFIQISFLFSSFLGRRCYCVISLL